MTHATSPLSLAAAVALSLVLTSFAARAAAAQENSYTTTFEGFTVRVTVTPLGSSPEAAGEAGVSVSRPDALLGLDLFEGFEDVSSLPDEGWVLINRSAPLGPFGWIQGDSEIMPSHQGPGNSYIASSVLATDPAGHDGTISNWLLSPPLTFVEGTVVTFETRTPFGSERPDRMEVRFSFAGTSTDVGTGPTSVGDFVNLPYTYNPDLEVGGYPDNNWSQFTLNFVNGPQDPVVGRVAMRHFVTQAGLLGPNGNYIGIDTFTYAVPPPADLEVSPMSLSATVPQGEMETQSLTVANPGGQALHWEIDDEPLRRVGAVEESDDMFLAEAALMDPQGEFVYIGTDNINADSSYIAKIALDPFEHDALLELPDGEEGIESAVIDPQGEFAYFGISTSPARVVKIDLATLERVGAIVLQPGQLGLKSAVIDPQGEFAYFGTFTSPGQVVKIDLDPFAHVGTITLPVGFDFLMSAAIDPDGQFAYFGAFVGAVPGLVTIDLESFQSVDGDSFAGVVGLPATVVIDPAGAFAYVGMRDASLWQIVKFDLEASDEVDAIAGDQEQSLYSAVMDPLGEYAYFGTATGPGKVLKIDLDPFERVEALTLDSGDVGLFSAVIDPAGNNAYFGTGLNPVRAVKVSLRMPECTLPAWLSVDTVGGTVPADGEEQTVGVTIDTTGLALGDYTANICVVSNDPATPVVMVPVSLTVTTPLVVLEFVPASLHFGTIPVGTASSPMTALLHNSGEGVAEGLDFDLVGNGFSIDAGACGTSLPPGGSCAVHASFHPFEIAPADATFSAHSNVATADLSLSGSGVAPPPVITVTPDILSSTLETEGTQTLPLTVGNLGEETLAWQAASDVAVFDRVAGIELNDGEADILAGVIDPAGEYAYFGTNTTPGRVVKVDLSTFRQVDAIFLAAGEDRLLSAVIDPAGQFAYFGTDTAPGRVLKIDLATFTRVDALTLPPGMDGLWTAAIDPAGTFAYFGTDTAPGRVAKIDLESLTIDSGIELVNGESFLRSAVIDPAGAFAYFGTNTLPGRVVKVDLSTFQRVDAFTAPPGEHNLVAAVIDPAGTFGYFGTANNPGRVVKVHLATMSHFGSLPLAQGENQLSSAVIAPDGEFAYFGTQTSPGRVVKIDLDPFVRDSAITLTGDENDLWRAVIDPVGEHAYFATRDSPGRIVKVALDRPDCTLPPWLSLDPTSGSVSGDGEQSVDVTFDATGLPPDQYEASLCLASNDHVTPLVPVPVTLTVTPPAAPALVFEPPGLDFGDVEVGTSVMLVATLTNSGLATANGLLFSALGNGFEADATGDCGTTLPPLQSCSVGITFAPTVPGPVDATLEVDSLEGASASLSVAGRGFSKTEVFTPVALEVDYRALASSDGNSVFESGEIVDVAPAWRHDGLIERPLSGEASAFTGPAGPDYDLVAGEAEYGLVQPEAIASCRDSGFCYQMGIGPPGAPRPAPHWDAVLDEQPSEGSEHSWTLHVGDSFDDVARTSLFYPWVESLLHNEVTSGCSGGRYCPAGANTRAQMAVFLLRAVEGGDYTPAACEAGERRFDDVPATSPFCRWIEELARRGVTGGCGNGNYCPASPVNRAQMAVFLLLALEGESYEPAQCNGVFGDVDCPSTFANWIEDLVARGITAGCGNGNYCPADPVTRGQMSVFLSKTFWLSLYGP